MSRKVVLMLGFVSCICICIPSFVAEGQQPTRVYRIGWLSPHVGAATVAGSIPNSFIRELHDLGYVEGRNLEFVVRLAQGRHERLPVLASELVALKPDVIGSLTTTATRAARQATATVPYAYPESAIHPERRVVEPWFE